MSQICNHCGRSVAPGSGRFVNRVPDCNDVETRKTNGVKFPEGDFVCAECDGKIRGDVEDHIYCVEMKIVYVVQAPDKATAQARAYKGETVDVAHAEVTDIETMDEEKAKLYSGG